LLTQARRFIRLPFFLSWWAYSFPLAAITIASFVVYEKTQNVVYLWIASSLLALVTTLVGIITIATLKAIRKHGICVAEH
jgi:tellurite resistance protein